MYIYVYIYIYICIYMYIYIYIYIFVVFYLGAEHYSPDIRHWLHGMHSRGKVPSLPTWTLSTHYNVVGRQIQELKRLASYSLIELKTEVL